MDDLPELISIELPPSLCAPETISYVIVEEGNYQRSARSPKSPIRPSSNRKLSVESMSKAFERVQTANFIIELMSVSFDMQTFHCGICLEHCSSEFSFTAENCTMNHQFCRPCMSSYCTMQVTDGVIEHFCGGVGEHCGGVLTVAELQSLVPPESFERFERLVQVKTNPAYRECPQCSKGSSRSEQAAERDQADMRCEGCGYQYCFYHSNAHPGMSCQQYARAMTSRARQELASSESMVTRTTKPCPHCQAQTEKNGGCNHMTCQACTKDWCWLCGSTMPNGVSTHYAIGNPFGCPGGQFTEDYAHVFCSRCISLARLSMIPLFIFTRLLILIWGLSLVILSLVGAFVGFFAAVLRALIEGVALQKVHWSGVTFSFTLCFTGVPFLVYLVADLPIQIALLPFALVYCALYSDEESTFTEHLVELCQSYSLCFLFCDSYIRAILG